MRWSDKMPDDVREKDSPSLTRKKCFVVSKAHEVSLPLGIDEQLWAFVLDQVVCTESVGVIEELYFFVSFWRASERRTIEKI